MSDKLNALLTNVVNAAWDLAIVHENGGDVVKAQKHLDETLNIYRVELGRLQQKAEWWEKRARELGWKP